MAYPVVNPTVADRSPRGSVAGLGRARLCAHARTDTIGAIRPGTGGPLLPLKGTAVSALKPTLRLGSAVLIASAMALGTSGCFAGPVEQIVNDTAEQAIEDAGGGDVDVNIRGGSVPDGWPDLPVPPGDITSSASTQDGFFVAITTPAGAGDALVEQLTAQGFTSTLTSETEGTRLVILSNDQWSVTLTWTADPGGAGDFLTYTVVSV